MSEALEKKAKEKILEQMDELGGEITTDDVVELLRPHYIFNIRKLREQALRRTANNLMATYRDNKGVRTCFSCKDDSGNSKYFNIETTTDLKALKNIEIQLNKKYKGLNISKKKVQRRRDELSGQVSFKEVSNS
ncbi:hypothetical protein [Clostridium beijerinckii]|uniref:Uncharacterized protein n=1 Tax=Clostridium beijerinckii TaxID=1520 RepID=A0AAE5H663_CLOBE|nr:hypothetical protein [Clostridium beijerinckii]NSB15868.1 hypothetical protein [Clostridium beijerinckii]OOM27991.1 hypothetical protein CLOBE_29090 [Clostridium beijerinckii]